MLGVKTLASCCGHGKYPTTIVIKIGTRILEFYSRKKLSIKKRNRYYKKDSEGYYFIPELL